MEKFTKLLDIKIKFIEIFLHNYENKKEEIDLNYQTIFNLQKEINFKVPNLSFYENGQSLKIYCRQIFIR